MSQIKFTCVQIRITDESFNFRSKLRNRVKYTACPQLYFNPLLNNPSNKHSLPPIRADFVMTKTALHINKHSNFFLSHTQFE